MKNLIDFFIETGKLKKMKRTGWVLRNVKDPETIAEHTFRMALMAWIFGSAKNLDTSKILKMALIHDLCEVYAGDMTPYDLLIIGKTKKDIKKLVTKWPGFTKAEKERNVQIKHKKEKEGLEKVVKTLPKDLRQEIFLLWEDYDTGKTKEGRFVKQLDRIENLLQAMEYWKKDKNFPIAPWWEQLKGLIDDPKLLEFMQALDQYYF